MQMCRTEAWPVRRPGLRVLLVGRRVVLDELQLAGAIGRPYHHKLRPDAGEPVDLVNRLALDRRPALTLEPQADEERGRGVEVVHDDTHMIETQLAHTSAARHDERVERGLPPGPDLLRDAWVPFAEAVEPIVVRSSCVP